MSVYRIRIYHILTNSKGDNLDSLDNACEPSFLKEAIRNAPELVPVIFGDLSSDGIMYPELDDTFIWSDNPLLSTFRRMEQAGRAFTLFSFTLTSC